MAVLDWFVDSPSLYDGLEHNDLAYINLGIFYKNIDNPKRYSKPWFFLRNASHKPIVKSTVINVAMFDNRCVKVGSICYICSSWFEKPIRKE